MRLSHTAMALALAFTTSAGGAALASGASDENSDVPWTSQLDQWNAVDATAPVDFGPGPGLGKPRQRRGGARAVAAESAATPSAIPTGGADAGVNGVYGQPVNWPIIAIHMALLPDGRVMTFGTDTNGVRGAELYFDVWDPSLGTGTDSHTLLPNTLDSDIFCAGQSLMWTTGELMTVGGDLRPQHKPNDADTDVTAFSPPAGTLSRLASMIYPRWYATLSAMPNGDLVAMGGRALHAGNILTGSPTPEVYHAATGWTALSNATSNAAFFTSNGWFYPRAYVAPNGLLFILTSHGSMFWLDPTGLGTLTSLGPTQASLDSLPSAMFAPGQILSLRGTNMAFVYDINGSTPVVTQTSNLSQARNWSNATVMADGKVLVNGGSAVSNKLTGIAYQNETWDPATGQWTLGASAAKARLYHSGALLLPDGSVFTSGGGSPGPIKQLNAEIFYPPYLYRNDGSGQPATRPTFAPASPVVNVGQQIKGTVGKTDQISRLTLVKMGTATHAMNVDQRFIELPFTQSGRVVTAMLPSNPNVLMPGYYLEFAINTAGTPAVASILLVQPSTKVNATQTAAAQ